MHVREIRVRVGAPEAVAARSQWWRLVGARSSLATPVPLRTSGRPSITRTIYVSTRPLAPPAALLLALPPRSSRSRAVVSPITAAEIDGHLRFLSSDLLEGRAPGTRGGRLAAEYIATPAPRVRRRARRERLVLPARADRRADDRSRRRVRATASGQGDGDAPPGRGRRALGGQRDAAVRGARRAGVRRLRRRRAGVPVGRLQGRGPEGQDPARARERSARAAVGADAVRRQRDDVLRPLDVQVRGGGAARRGGRAHRAPHRSGGLSVARCSSARTRPDQRLLPRDPKLPPPLGVRGWITDSAATALLRQAGLDLAALRAQAATREFRPVADGDHDGSRRSRARCSACTSENVVGVVRGRDPQLSKEYVALLGALGPPRHRHAGERRLDLQRRVRQRVGRGDRCSPSRARGGDAAAARSARCSSSS